MKLHLGQVLSLSHDQILLGVRGARGQQGCLRFCERKPITRCGDVDLELTPAVTR